ncbi:MAG: heparinase II/III family protein, partial [Oscillospiraceae bacterium]
VTRSSWDKNAVGATMGISNGGIHCHFDDLNIVIAAYGKYLLADPGKMPYVEDEPFRGWLNSTRAHNTIEINDISQRSGLWSNSEMIKGPVGEKLVFPFRPKNGISRSSTYVGDEILKPQNADVKQMLDTKDYTQDNLKKIYDFDDDVSRRLDTANTAGHYQGRFLENELTKTFDYVKGETPNNIDVSYKDDKGYFGPKGQVYKGLDNEHNRSMLFIKPGFYIVTDYVAPVNDNTEINKYNQTWHFANDADISMDPTSKIVRTNYNDANIAVVPVMGNDVPVESNLEDGWYHVSGTVPAKYVSYVKRADKPTTFNTMLIPMETGKDFDVSTKTIVLDGIKESDASAFNFVMKEKKTGDTTNGTYYNIHNNEIKKQRNIGEYATDGRMMYIDKGLKYYKTAILSDGMNIQDNSGKYIVKSNKNVSNMGINWSGDEIELSTTHIDNTKSDYVDLNSLTILSEKNIQKVTLNGENIPFKKSGSYIYFGSSPIIDGGTVPTPKPTPSSSAKPSSPHGSGGGGGGGGVIQPTPTVAPTAQPTEKPSDNKNFKAELENHWGKEEITKMIDAGIVKGENEKTLGLQNETTRAEFVTMLVRGLKFDVVKYD